MLETCLCMSTRMFSGDYIEEGRPTPKVGDTFSTDWEPILWTVYKEKKGENTDRLPSALLPQTLGAMGPAASHYLPSCDGFPKTVNQNKPFLTTVKKLASVFDIAKWNLLKLLSHRSLLPKGELSKCVPFLPFQSLFQI